MHVKSVSAYLLQMRIVLGAWGGRLEVLKFSMYTVAVLVRCGVPCSLGWVCAVVMCRAQVLKIVARYLVCAVSFGARVQHLQYEGSSGVVE